MTRTTEYLALKWGAPKAWEFPDNPEAIRLLNEYASYGWSISAALQPSTDNHRDALCRLIDSLADDAHIQSDWDGKRLTKEQAKAYVLDYDRD